MEKIILHMDLDSFFVSCERLLDSRLYGRPILVGGTGDRGVVSASSYEARKFGAYSGMPMKTARLLCPEAIVIKGNAGTYTKFSKMVTDIIQEKVPVFEKSSIDEFYADLSGMDKFFGSYKYASEIRKTISKETGLPISFGLSKNKTVSKIATNEAKPNNQMKIDYGDEKTFLAPLSSKKIPMVGDKTFQRLSKFGLNKIFNIQQTPIDLMEKVFGKNGSSIWKKANGVDNSPIIKYHERKSISNERTFGRDTSDIKLLKANIIAMTENLAYQLRRGNKMCSNISVKIRYSDFNTHTQQKKIIYTSSDHILIPKAIDLFDNLYNKRLLIRLVGIKLSDLTSGWEQISIFENNIRHANLYKAMDSIRERFGSRTVIRASGLSAKTIGTGGNPFNGEPPIVLAHRTT